MELDMKEVARWSEYLIRVAVSVDGADRNKSLTFFASCLATNYHVCGSVDADEFITHFLSCVNSQMQTLDESLKGFQSAGIIKGSYQYSATVKDIKLGKEQMILNQLKAFSTGLLPEIKDGTLIPIMSTLHATTEAKSVSELSVAIGMATSYAMLEDFAENDFKDFSISFMDKVTSKQFVRVIKRSCRLLGLAIE